jgi:type II secretory pathway component PulJ
VLLTLLASSAFAHDLRDPGCVQNGEDIVARRAALQRAPTMLGKRLELANMLQKAGCYEGAVHLLEEGQRYTPLSPILQFSLRRARNALTQHEDAAALAARDRQRMAAETPARSESRTRQQQERPTQLAATHAAAEAMVEPPIFSNAAEATRSN